MHQHLEILQLTLRRAIERVREVEAELDLLQSMVAIKVAPEGTNLSKDSGVGD